jgi:hypothetical protein
VHANVLLLILSAVYRLFCEKLGYAIVLLVFGERRNFLVGLISLRNWTSFTP